MVLFAARGFGSHNTRLCHNYLLRTLMVMSFIYFLVAISLKRTRKMKQHITAFTLKRNQLVELAFRNLN